MPLLRKGSQGATAERGRSPSKTAAAGRPASKGRSSQADPRKTPTPVPAGAQQQTPASALATAADDYAMPVREVVRPANQLALSAGELEEEVGRSLTAGNPTAPANLVRYSFRERGYRAEPIIDQQLQHFALGGCLMHCESEEAARHRAAFNFADRAAQTGHHPPRDRATRTEPPPTAVTAGSCSRWEIYEAYVQDQERQRQTEELARQKAQVARKGNQQAAAAMAQRAAELALAPAQWDLRGGDGLAALPGQAACLVERMVQQNLLKDVAMDFRYWDDPADAVAPEEGTLLPLWGEKGESFTSPRVKRRAVTALCWSPRYFDLFAVGYGSFDFLNPTTGLVCCYSLKSPGQPEFSFGTAAGVMCLDFHPDHPSLLAVGCYDGAVVIFDLRAGKLRRAGDKPAYQSTPRSGKHSDPVWQVCWQRTHSHELALSSISTDGRVTAWTVNKNELSHQDVLQLSTLRARERLVPPLPPAAAAAAAAEQAQAQPQPLQQLQQQRSDSSGGSEEESGSVGIAGGCCFDFNREQEFLFVVGSEDGSLYKCSTAYSSEYLQAYQPGHRLPVYAVRWNGLHPRTFLSAGADWKVKLWDSVLPKPVLSFDLRAPVGDVAWAPFSATVFAAVTDAGKVHVFDLARSRAAAACVQRVTRKARLTKLAFNARHPVLLVGTEHGGVVCLKLSPNLRRDFAPGAPASGGGATLGRSDSEAAAARAAEAQRLEAVLVLAAKCNQALREEDWELM